MNENSISEYISGSFDDVQIETSEGNLFFFHGDDHKFPFVTLVTSDAYDTVSDLNRPGVFRLNIGVSGLTYNSLFPAPGDAGGVSHEAHDYTALNRLMPHPVYGSMYWVCILNPDDTTFHEIVAPLLAEAYTRASLKQSQG